MQKVTLNNGVEMPILDMARGGSAVDILLVELSQEIQLGRGQSIRIELCWPGCSRQQAAHRARGCGWIAPNQSEGGQEFGRGFDFTGIGSQRICLAQGLQHQELKGVQLRQSHLRGVGFDGSRCEGTGVSRSRSAQLGSQLQQLGQLRIGPVAELVCETAWR